MAVFSVLATGKSLTLDQAENAQGIVIAVSDAYKLAPQANYLISADRAWWDYHNPVFHGRKLCHHAHHLADKIEGVPAGTNSGALAIHFAIQQDATEIYLYGFDGDGAHFFGKHPAPLKNTTADRLKIHMKQHEMVARIAKEKGVKIINTNPNSSIEAYK